MPIQTLETCLFDLLTQNPVGTDVYTLIKALQNKNYPGFPKISLTEPLALFQMNFRLFHGLYCLRDQLWQTQQAHLDISALQIKLHAYQPGQKDIVLYDPVRAYFLDLNNLESTTAEDVKELLGKFWGKFYAHTKKKMALETLGLKEPIDYPKIKRHYRYLVMQHHPDRGGNKTRLQEINAAMTTLNEYYL